MKPIYKHRKAIFLSLMLLLGENIVGAYVFDVLSNAYADYRGQLEFIANEQSDPEKPVSSCNVKIAEGPNGSRDVYIQCSVSAVCQVSASGEYFDQLAYIRHVTFWKTLENTFNVIRDIHKEMFWTTVCIIIVFSLGLSLEQFLEKLHQNPKVMV